jgi:hypothetical protein
MLKRWLKMIWRKKGMQNGRELGRRKDRDDEKKKVDKCY